MHVGGIMATTTIAKAFDKNLDINNDDTYWLEEIGPNELREYREMLKNLGFYPDKVQINTLTMIAEDYAPLGKSASDVYNLIREMLVNPKIMAGKKLTLIYVIDSILKNAKGQYVPLIEETAFEWIEAVYKMMEHREEEQRKLRKVVSTWRDFGIFQPESLAKMFQVFDEADAAAQAKADTEHALLNVTPTVRKQMQLLLSSMHEGVDELNKISIERLAQINPKLLSTIRQEATDMVARSADVNITGAVKVTENTGPFGGWLAYEETRTPQEIQRSLEWTKVNYFSLNQGEELVSDLQNLVLDGTALAGTASHSSGGDLIDLLVAASAASKCLSHIIQNTRSNQTDAASKKKRPTANSYQEQLYPQFLRTAAGFGGRTDAQRYVPKDSFTNDGIKEKNSWAIGSLYDQLPFVSTSDGRRFGSQLEISKHIDALFRKSQTGKVMERTEERGWYPQETEWSGILRRNDEATVGNLTSSEAPFSTDDGNISVTNSILADETRSKCCVCGLLFKMLFDNDHGEWMYKDCREIEVLNDDAAENESDLMLVHFTCWRKVGSPDQLIRDQIL